MFLPIVSCFLANALNIFLAVIHTDKIMEPWEYVCTLTWPLNNFEITSSLADALNIFSVIIHAKIFPHIIICDVCMYGLWPMYIYFQCAPFSIHSFFLEAVQDVIPVL